MPRIQTECSANPRTRLIGHLVKRFLLLNQQKAGTRVKHLVAATAVGQKQETYQVNLPGIGQPTRLWGSICLTVFDPSPYQPPNGTISTTCLQAVVPYQPPASINLICGLPTTKDPNSTTDSHHHHHHRHHHHQYHHHLYHHHLYHHHLYHHHPYHHHLYHGVGLNNSL